MNQTEAIKKAEDRLSLCTHISECSENNGQDKRRPTMIEIERAIEKKEYIERGAALELFWEYSGNWNLINAIPTADVEPVVRGEWVPNKRHDGCMVCDQCGFGIEAKTIVFVDCNRRSDEREFSICAGDLPLAYCPHCGAHMERSGDA